MSRQPPPETDDDYDEEHERMLQAWNEACRLDAEALKHEVWNCKVGDLLEVVVGMTLTDWPEPGVEPTLTEMKAEGQIYRVVDLKGRGFDLELVSGNGVPEIRVMNSKVPENYRVLPQP